MTRTCRSVLLALALFALPVAAQQTTFIFDLDASQVVGGSTSTATGKAYVTLDANDLCTITVHHDVPNASLMTLNTGAIGSPGATYNLFVISSNPAQASFTLFTPGDALTMMADGFFIEIFQPGAGTADIRGQIANGFPGQVFISEYCNDPIPPAQSIGLDTNLDGVPANSANQADDEFVEIVNGTDAPVTLDNWYITDAVQTRHTFPMGTTLLPGEAIVVFGGGDVTNFTNFGLQAQTANAAPSFALGLNNSGDTITLFDITGTMVDQVVYVSQGPGDGDGESIVKVPETPLGTLMQSTMQPFNPTHTPGRRKSDVFPWSTSALPFAAYPGNGTDAAIEVGINGVPDVQPTNIHTVNAGDVVQLRYYSPGNTLTNFPFLAVAQPFTTGFPAPPSAFVGDPVPTIIYSGALPTFILADGLTSPFLPFTPVLGSFVHSGAIPMSVGGTNTSYMILLISFDPGRNAQDLGNAEAHELVIP